LAVQRGLKRVPANRQNEVRAMQLDFLINNTLVDQYLTQLKVAVDAKEVQQRMEQIRGEIKKQGKTLEKVLEELTITEAELQTQVEGDLRWDKFANNQASEAELRKYFEAGREVFDGSQVRARHILLTPASKDGQGEDPAQVQLQVFKKQLEEAGAAAVAKVPAGADPLAKEKARAEALEQGFIALAKEKSACPSKKDGGDTDWFPRTRGMVEPFARAAFGLKPFQLSEVVKTEFGYHLILVTDRRPGKEVKFEDVKNEVKEVYCERLREAIVVYMRPKSKIVISPPPKSGS
jgi:parvulin-like peptidyl-prolyl isomerase